MKAVILAGGLGSRLSEETTVKPKPMVEIGGRPILWHIMKIYSQYGINDFVICLGYKGYVIKEYFSNYLLHNSDVIFDGFGPDSSIKYIGTRKEDWKVTLLDTGENSMTGGRLKRAKDYISGERFFFTYGDGVSDIDINKLLAHHLSHNKLATVTAVQPPGRFGKLEFDDENGVVGYTEKPQGDGAWINGGFFVLEPDVLDFIESDNTVWEDAPIKQLVNQNQLSSYQHSGYWHSMDTLRDQKHLDKLCRTGAAPWINWDNQYA